MSAPAHRDDYLALGDLIIARLQAELDPATGDAIVPERNVLAAAELAQMAETQQPTPAVHVIFAGDELVAGDGGYADEGGEQVVRQRWYTVVAVRNVRNARRGDAAREDAGRVISAVLAALSGWRPGTGYTALVRRAAPDAAYSTGYFYVPLVWAANLVTLGAQS